MALLLALWVWFFSHGSVLCQRPAVVNIGAVFTFNSVIGRTSRAAMELAVSDVNSDPAILNGTQLKLIMGDANCSVFRGSIVGTFKFSLSVIVLAVALLHSGIK